MTRIYATVLKEKKFWVGIFERNDEQGHAVARKIFGDEPSDPELFDFVLHHFDELNFSKPTHDFELIIQRKNFKRRLRDVKKEMQKAKNHMPSSKAQDALRETLELNKKEKKSRSKTEKLAHEKKHFALKQEKKKQKHRGH